MSEEPVLHIQVNNLSLTLLGTAHVSAASVEQVNKYLQETQYDAVAVELCDSRFKVLTEPDAVANLNLFEVIKSGKAPMIAANLALSAYQQRLADQFGVTPGAEMRAAVTHANANNQPLWLIDREIGTTLRRVYNNVPWWRRLYLLSGLFASMLSRDQVSEEEIENLKTSDMLQSTFSQFAEQAEDLYKPLIDERDQFMASRLLEELEKLPPEQQHKALVVIGAGHLHGMAKYLTDELISDPSGQIVKLNDLPRKKSWFKLIPWLIVALILLGFMIGFSRSSDLGWQLVVDWVLINGGLSALGAIIAAAHPLTVIGAFIAAPLTSLNPTIGAGMVTAALETWLRKPRVSDFSKLRQDTTHWRGWWRNRVTRVLLVFILSTLGSAIGTYVAGFRIIERLT